MRRSPTCPLCSGRMARHEEVVVEFATDGTTYNYAWVCTECVFDDGGWLCETCAVKHECGEEMLLPVVNSPRVGMCGYTGPGLAL